jgi:hypothetical protein
VLAVYAGAGCEDGKVIIDGSDVDEVMKSDEGVSTRFLMGLTRSSPYHTTLTLHHQMERCVLVVKMHGIVFLFRARLSAVFGMAIILRQQSLNAKRQRLNEGWLHHGLMVTWREQHLQRTSESIAPSKIAKSSGILGRAEHDDRYVDRTNLPLFHSLVVVFRNDKCCARPRERILDEGLLPCTERLCDAE